MSIDIDAIRRDIHTRQQFIDLNMPVPTFTASKVADAALALLAELDRLRAVLAEAQRMAHAFDTPRDSSRVRVFVGDLRHVLHKGMEGE